ncbi:MAG: hypothetical protein V1839_02760 [archaeon]
MKTKEFWSVSNKTNTKQEKKKVDVVVSKILPRMPNNAVVIGSGTFCERKTMGLDYTPSSLNPEQNKRVRKKVSGRRRRKK